MIYFNNNNNYYCYCYYNNENSSGSNSSWDLFLRIIAGKWKHSCTEMNSGISIVNAVISNYLTGISILWFSTRVITMVSARVLMALTSRNII